MSGSMTWVDGTVGGTPLSAANLNNLAVTADVGTAGTPTGDALRKTYAQAMPPPLYGYVSALGLARSQRCRVYFLGDSIMEGQGSSTIANRWVNQALNLMRTRYGPSSTGGQHIPGAYYAAPTNGGTAFASWATTGTTYPTYNGPGARSIQLTASSTATITQTCTSATLYFQLPYAGPSGTVTVDSGTAQSITLSTSGITSWSSGALSAGSHTFKVTNTGGDIYFAGGVFYNGDESTGITFWDGARSGATASYFDTNNDWVNHLAVLGTDLLVIGLGTNDANTSGGYSSAQFSTYLGSIISRARTAIPNVPILLMPPYKPIITTVEPWSNYVAAMQAKAASTAYTGFYDMGASIPDLTSDPYGTLQDGVHPTSRGHALLANVAAFALSPH